MTVTTIPGLLEPARRTFENANRPTNQTAGNAATQSASASATLPNDVIAASVTNPAVDYQTAITLTQAQNREAARSTLSDADLDQLQQAPVTAQQAVAANPQQAVDVQTNRLAPSMLQMLVE